MSVCVWDMYSLSLGGLNYSNSQYQAQGDTKGFDVNYSSAGSYDNAAYYGSHSNPVQPSGSMPATSSPNYGDASYSLGNSSMGKQQSSPAPTDYSTYAPSYSKPSNYPRPSYPPGDYRYPPPNAPKSGPSDYYNRPPNPSYPPGGTAVPPPFGNRPNFAPYASGAPDFDYSRSNFNRSGAQPPSNYPVGDYHYPYPSNYPPPSNPPYLYGKEPDSHPTTSESARKSRFEQHSSKFDSQEKSYDRRFDETLEKARQETVIEMEEIREAHVIVALRLVTHLHELERSRVTPSVLVLRVVRKAIHRTEIALDHTRVLGHTLALGPILDATVTRLLRLVTTVDLIPILVEARVGHVALLLTRSSDSTCE